jgi:glutathione S-transferase
MITISAFRVVPPFAKGLVRDLRVRWALEEAGIPYRVHYLTQEEKAAPEYRDWQPFGQVPAFEEDGFRLFETGAILLYIGERSEALLPRDPQGKARATQWMISALNSIETQVQTLTTLDIGFSGQEGVKPFRAAVEDRVKARLAVLAGRLGGQDYLNGRFTIADIMMTTVLRILRHTDLVAKEPAVKAYQDRCEARPAFQRALKGQMDGFVEAA